MTLSTVTSTIEGNSTAVSAGNLRVTLSTNNGANVFYMNEFGNVGIGTTTPGQKLTVVGSAQFTNVISSTYGSDLNLTADGTLTKAASDIRLKENLEALNSSSTLDKILQLKPYNFTWINDPTHRKDVGLIAQDVATIFPEITFTNTSDGFMGINYSRLPALLVAGLQGQQMLLGSYTHDISVQAMQTLMDEAKAEAERNPLIVIGDRAAQGLKTLTDVVSLRITAVRGYFSQVFSKEVTTDKLCVTKTDGSKVCVNGDQLESLLNHTPTPSQTQTVQASTDTPVSEPTASSTTEEPVVTPTEPVEPEPAPEPEVVVAPPAGEQLSQ